MKNQETIAQQLKVKEFPFIIRDSKGNAIYWENRDGLWCKYEYDSKNDETRWESSSGYWENKEYDSKGLCVYFETSNGVVLDVRTKNVELTMDEIATKFGVDVNLLKIKK
jgi:hypothetical protein